MLKRVKHPERYRLGHEYNEAVDKCEHYHNLFIEQMKKTADLQSQIDERENIIQFYRHVDSPSRYLLGAI